jgi:hypothetical protein
MKTLVIVIMCLLESNGAFACSGKIVSAAALQTLVYNPFDAADAQQLITIKILNSGNDRCAYQLSVPESYLPFQFAPDLRFAIVAPGVPSGQAAVQSVTPLLQPSQSFQLHFTMVVFRGQRSVFGVLTKMIGLVLTPAGAPRATVDEIEVPLLCSIPQIHGINLAGSGTGTSFQFSGIGSKASKSVVLQTRATHPHYLEIRASSGYLLHEGGGTSELSKIPFSFAIDGQTYQLASDTALRLAGSPGQASRLLSVTIGDTIGKLAGTYKATITIRIGSSL